MDNPQNLVETTKDYYDSHDADNFYHVIWGGEDIHVGIYESPHEDIFTASKRTVQRMAARLGGLDGHTRILDLGAGYGGAARYLASHFSCHITCLNLSEAENIRNRQKNESLQLTSLIEVHQGNFEQIPFAENQFDVVWSEDAILHSGEKEQVFREVTRVLKPGGDFIFTDPMQSDTCPEGVLDPILARIHLEELGSVKRYRALAAAVGLLEKEVEAMPEQLVNHYTRVHAELNARKEELQQVCSPAYLDRMSKGLIHWIEGGQQGYLNWGILTFQKPAG